MYLLKELEEIHTYLNAIPDMEDRDIALGMLKQYADLYEDDLSWEEIEEELKIIKGG